MWQCNSLSSVEEREHTLDLARLAWGEIWLCQILSIKTKWLDKIILKKTVG